MPNRLINETSPYLLQHAHNPVEWYPWGEEALSKAHAEDKPIFLSIGYYACHWCHVMEHESFEDETTAAVMNDLFVNIKVDREERPDLDSIYMSAVVGLTGSGGWPMSVFLTPDGRPFYGGTYFPPTPRHGMPSFRDVLKAVADAWQNRREDILKNSDGILGYLKQANDFVGQVESQSLATGTLSKAELVISRNFDRVNGGWGGAPKFPQPMTLEFLLRRYTQTPDANLRLQIDHTLHAMARGGMYDQLGGGFHRYSTDAHWLVPHFEKMLYDNSQLARVYLHAAASVGRSVLSPHRDRDSGLRGARDDASRRRLLLNARRRFRRHRRQVLRVDGGRSPIDPRRRRDSVQRSVRRYLVAATFTNIIYLKGKTFSASSKTRSMWRRPMACRWKNWK